MQPMQISDASFESKASGRGIEVSRLLGLLGQRQTSLTGRVDGGLELSGPAAGPWTTSGRLAARAAGGGVALTGQGEVTGRLDPARVESSLAWRLELESPGGASVVTAWWKWPSPEYASKNHS